MCNIYNVFWIALMFAYGFCLLPDFPLEVCLSDTLHQRKESTQTGPLSSSYETGVKSNLFTGHIRIMVAFRGPVVCPEHPTPLTSDVKSAPTTTIRS